MPEFRFTLDPNGTPTVVENPIGWDTAEIKLVRDDKIRGLFTEYTTELEFHSGGYTYLNNLLNTTGVCATVDVLIQRRCEGGDWEDFYDGIIYLSEAEIDIQGCIIKVRILNATFQDIIKKYLDFSFTITDTKSINGEAVTPTPTVQTQLHRISPHNLTFPSYFLGNINTWRVYKVLEYLIAALSDNDATFVSNFFSTAESRQSIRVTFSAALVAGDTVTISWQAFIGTTVSVVVPFAASNDATIDEITRLLVSFATPNLPPNMFKPADFSVWNTIYWAAASNDNPGGTYIQVYTFIPFYNITASVAHGGGGTATATVSEITAYNDGQKNLCLTGDTQILGTSAGISISLGEIFEELDKHFNLMMRFYLNAGVPTVQIEKFEYFFDIVETLRIVNIPDIQRAVVDDFNNRAIKVGEGGADEHATFEHIFRKTTIGAQDCIGDKLDADNDYKSNSESIWHRREEAIMGTDIEVSDAKYFITAIDATASSTTSKPFTLQLRKGVGGTTFKYYHGYNYQMTSIHAMYYHQTQIASPSFWYDGHNTPNRSALRLQYGYEFEYPLTKTQFDSIRINGQQFITINEGADAANDKRGWIKELSFSVKTGLTKFNLVSDE